MNTLSLPNDPPLILVVDDDKMTRLLLCQRLEQEGYKVVEASNGVECLAVYKSLQPQIILLAAMMPVMDGFTCCTHLRSLPESAHTPVLIITEDDQDSINQAFAVGATDYITKPFQWVVLIHRVRRLLKQSQIYQQLEAANQKLQILSGTDDLTQVANRQKFNKSFDLEWRRMARGVLPLSLILCDIDFFKLYNEIYCYEAASC
jgi:PleD family two-component response regulator